MCQAGVRIKEEASRMDEAETQATMPGSLRASCTTHGSAAYCLGEGALAILNALQGRSKIWIVGFYSIHSSNLLGLHSYSFLNGGM